MAHFIRTSRATKLGIGGQGSLHVARHVYFGNDSDVPLARILHDIPCILLCIEPSIRLSVVDICIVSHDGACAFGANLRQFGILFNLNAPALVVSQVPMKGVHVVECQQIYKPFHEIY